MSFLLLPCSVYFEVPVPLPQSLYGRTEGRKDGRSLVRWRHNQIFSGWGLSISLRIKAPLARRRCVAALYQISSLACDWSKRATWLNMPLLKPGNIAIFPIPKFSKLRVFREIFEGKQNIIPPPPPFDTKYALIFVLRYYLLLSLPRTDHCKHISLCAVKVSR